LFFPSQQQPLACLVFSLIAFTFLQESASFLVQHGADPKTTNNAGSTPAETAAEDQNEELCQFYGTVEDQQQQAAKNAPQ
jgi:ankyrin repeat protein